MARVQSVDVKAVFVFVGDANAHTLSSWSLSLQLIGTGVMLFIFVISLVVSSWFAVPLTLLVIDSTL